VVGLEEEGEGETREDGWPARRRRSSGSILGDEGEKGVGLDDLEDEREDERRSGWERRKRREGELDVSSSEGRDKRFELVISSDPSCWTIPLSLFELCGCGEGAERLFCEFR